MSPKCPVCGRPTGGAMSTAEHRPFCGPRCADVDLGRWLTEQYRVPTDEAALDTAGEDERTG